MTRRQLLLLLVAAALMLCATAGWVVWLTTAHTAITRQHAASVQAGMTLAEVEEILGDRARAELSGSGLILDSTEQPNSGFHQHGLMLHSHATPRPIEWQSDEVVISVQFSIDARVSSCYYLYTCRADDNIVAVVRRSMRL
jgi:hypothetical protein